MRNPCSLLELSVHVSVAILEKPVAVSVAARFVGGVGIPTLTPVEGAEAGPGPTALVATTVNV
jgi:hypothetical protein